MISIRFARDSLNVIDPLIASLVLQNLIDTKIIIEQITHFTSIALPTLMKLIVIVMCIYLLGVSE